MLALANIKRGVEHYRKRGNANQIRLDENARFDTWEALKVACGKETAATVVMTWLFPDLWEKPGDVEFISMGYGEWLALNRFVQPKRMPNGRYSFRRGLDQECATIWYEQQKLLHNLTERDLP